MSILYSKLRLEVPQVLDGENATITSEHGNSRVVQMSSPITDIMLAGMEKYRVQAGITDESVSFGYGEIKKVEALAGPEIYNIVKNASDNITEAQWLEFVDSGCIALAREFGETSSFIGKNVTLSNSVVSSYTSWKIADFNHDSSGDTVDLVQNNAIYQTKFGNSQAYSSSTARSWLTGTYLPGFSTDVQNKLLTMTVVTGSGNTSDKIKLLSCDEVGITSTHVNYQYSEREGSRYPIFNAGGTGQNQADSSRVRTGVHPIWWLRSRRTDNTYLWCIYEGGGLYGNGPSNSRALVPCIRFA